MTRWRTPHNVTAVFGTDLKARVPWDQTYKSAFCTL